MEVYYCWHCKKDRFHWVSLKKEIICNECDALYEKTNNRLRNIIKDLRENSEVKKE